MISVAEAIQIVRQHTAPLTTERVPIEEALGRVLAEDVVADTDLPPFDRSQMDGYAVRAQDAKEAPVRLRIVGESAAGKGWHHQLEEGHAVRIMTGGVIPTGADTVVMQERVSASASEVKVPAGWCRIRVEEILYQPERSGDSL